MRRFGSVLLALTLLGAGCQRAHVAREYAIDRVPRAMAPAVADADSAIARLQRRLGARLMAELSAKGPAGATAVCRDSAQAVTAEIAAATGIKVGRTSNKLRNAGNAPPAWARARVEAVAEGSPASSYAPVAVDLGVTVGVLRPIATQTLCLQCHGAADSLSAGLVQVLRESYPDDRAVGFREGDLRGFIWAEAPRRP